MAFTEFYCTSLGSNLNAGGLSNGAEPGPNAVLTSTNGNWSTTTNNFKLRDGVNPSGSVNVGDFASIYTDGASSAVYIARITAVQNAANGNVTMSTTAIYGTAPSTSGTARSMKVGGAWKGPNGTDTLPFGLTGGTIGDLVNASSERVRLNVKNNQTYSMTGALSFATLGAATLQGYSSSAGDGGKSILTSNITSAANFTLSGTGMTIGDIIFVSTGGSGTNHTVSSTATGALFFRCVFHGGRGSGINLGAGTATSLIECEAYDCNKSNTANLGGFSSSGSSVGAANFLYCCYSHDHASGTNAHGFSIAGSGMILVRCIADTCAGCGYTISGSNIINTAVIINCDFYNNAVDAIKFSNTGSVNAFAYIMNNNFIKNAGKGINNTLSGQGGIIYNNGRGSGTQANGSSDTLAGLINGGTDITYIADATPWVAPATGNFSINLAGARNAGRGVFIETDGTQTGTIAYPDIGAAQHYDSQKSSTGGG